MDHRILRDGGPTWAAHVDTGPRKMLTEFLEAGVDMASRSDDENYYSDYRFVYGVCGSKVWIVA